MGEVRKGSVGYPTVPLTLLSGVTSSVIPTHEGEASQMPLCGDSRFLVGPWRLRCPRSVFLLVNQSTETVDTALR